VSELAQGIVVAGLVAGAVAYIGARAWRKAAAARRPRPGCDSGCGCG
jgi:hypothetical protein